ncbi:hypothetical protein DAI22_09g156600 [Oryza sativa Japonica Group]|nr:hypothetical protein DAI22_09g156600 [Oryza sativa Japonica Group]
MASWESDQGWRKAQRSEACPFQYSLSSSSSTPATPPPHPEQASRRRRRPSSPIAAMSRRGDWVYENNGGTCVAIAGADYCVVAADTRLSVGYNILTRDHSKICELADKCALASSGFQGDIKALHKNLAARELLYQHQHNKRMSCPAMAQLLSNTLYYKRFFPYYAFNVLGGLDSEGKVMCFHL